MSIEYLEMEAMEDNVSYKLLPASLLSEPKLPFDAITKYDQVYEKLERNGLN
jgi:hypothetical protein